MIDHVARYILPAAYAVLPPVMHTARADVLLIAIGLQESAFLFRRQVRGPARGFWQFERAGIKGVLTHDRTRAPLAAALAALRYGRVSGDVTALHSIVEHNDVVAAVFARLLLWSLPGRLAAGTAAAWDQYLAAWRPGKPHPKTWDQNFIHADALIAELYADK